MTFSGCCVSKLSTQQESETKTRLRSSSWEGSGYFRKAAPLALLALLNWIWCKSACVTRFRVDENHGCAEASEAE
jgi:hypothetical protein